MDDTDEMNRPLVVVRRVDGRLYPPTWPNTPPEVTQRLVDLAHHLRCREGLTYKGVQAAMMERYGERRSVGQIWKDVHNNVCSRCAPQPPAPPDPRQQPRAYAWR